MSDIEYIKYLQQMAIALRFSFPKNFKSYSSKRLIRLYNGVGADWMPKWLRKVTTWLCRLLCDKAEAAVLIHDFEYTRKKTSYWRFTVANVRLTYNAAKSSRPFLGIAAAILCQLFGWGAYKAGKEVLSNGTPY